MSHLLTGIFLPLHLLFFAHAAQAEVACVERDAAEAKQVNDLLNRMKDGQANHLKSVDDFLAALPDGVKQNFMIVTNSRSLQASNPPGGESRGKFNSQCRRTEERDGVEKPVCPEARVIVYSKDADVMCSFTTSKQVRGSDEVECMMFDAKTSKVTPWELQFPKDAKDDPDFQKKNVPHAEKDPDKCVHCHGNPTNYRIDPYRFWGDTIPFMEDMLRKGSYETECYEQFLDRIQNGEDRLRNLKPVNTKAEIEEGIAEKGQYQLKSPHGKVNFSGHDSPSLNLSHTLLEKNGCRTASELTDRPDWNKIKYAALGAFLNCPKPDTFLPPGGADAAKKYFADRNIGVKDGKFSRKNLLDDTELRQAELLNVKKSRIAWQMEQYVCREGAERELAAANQQVAAGGREGYGLTNFENYSTNTERTAELRYLLEPLGVDVSQWSMAVDRQTYSHVEFLFSLEAQQPFIDILDKELGLDVSGKIQSAGVDPTKCNDNTTDTSLRPSQVCAGEMDALADVACPKLAELSRAALSRDLPAAKPLEKRDICLDREQLANQALRATAKLGLQFVQQRGRDILANECAVCHTDGLFGAPQHPFADHEKLEHQLQETKNDPGNLATIVWDRVNRPAGTHGHMPHESDMLSPADRVILKAYLDSVQAGQVMTPLPGPDVHNPTGKGLSAPNLDDE